MYDVHDIERLLRLFELFVTAWKKLTNPNECVEI